MSRFSAQTGTQLQEAWVHHTACMVGLSPHGRYALVGQTNVVTVPIPPLHLLDVAARRVIRALPMGVLLQVAWHPDDSAILIMNCFPRPHMQVIQAATGSCLSSGAFPGAAAD